MAANKYEKVEHGTIKRNEIHGADYNPRKISESARKKLRKNIQENGIVQPIIVNRRTMTVVGGHQRLDIMDSLMRQPDYELTVAFIDVDEKKEAELNIFLNNAAAQGEWDITALGDIKELFPDIDYVADLGFDESDIDVMFGDDFLRKVSADLEESYDEFTADPVKQAKAAARANKQRDMAAEDYRAMKKGMREKAKAENAENGS
jgi:ParB-like chromosome segregation protein Spo0J